MVINVSEPHAVLNDLFNDAARRLARQTEFCLRERKLTGPAFAKALVFCLLEKHAPSLEDFADHASQHLHVHVTYKAFDERFGQRSVDFLAALLGEALAHCFTARRALLPVLRRFNGVFLRDATTVSLPACLADIFPARKGKDGTPTAALKVVLEMEVSSGQFTELEVMPGLDNDKTSQIAAKPLPEGSLLLEDMGFLCGKRLQDYMNQGVYFLTRVPHWTAFFVKRRRGKGFERLDLVRSAIRTADKVRKRSASLLAALRGEEDLSRQIEGLSRQFAQCKIQKRHRRLSTFDRLAALDAEFRQLDLAA